MASAGDKLFKSLTIRELQEVERLSGARITDAGFYSLSAAIAIVVSKKVPGPVLTMKEVQDMTQDQLDDKVTELTAALGFEDDEEDADPKGE